MRTILITTALVLLGGGVSAQTILPKSPRLTAPEPVPSIAVNSVTNLHSEGDTLWVGPLAYFTSDGGATWINAGADSLTIKRGRLFSIDVEKRITWIGIGYSKEVNQGAATDFIASALGFTYSEDGGSTWTFRTPQLDQPDDTVEVYGINRLAALPIIVPEQSPPFDIDFDPVTGWVWTAAWASGIRRSEDSGRTWSRVVLPPDTLDEIRPDREYNFVFAPERNPNEAANNFLGFSVLVDEEGTVWAGTAGGLNRSIDAREAGSDASWRRFSWDGSTASLVGNWIISIEEQPLDGRNAIWTACWPATEEGEDFGITVTRDGGETLEQVLIGEKVYDFAFDEDYVYAAGDNGLFISEDDGRTWTTVRHFVDANQPDRQIKTNAIIYSVQIVKGDLWVGTEDGLLKSTDGGVTWSLFRADVPLSPSMPSPLAPPVDTYAYPNPFSPTSDGLVRIRYELASEQSVTVRIFDFSSRLVRTVLEGTRPNGVLEIAWDGIDDRGVRVPNGVYFYTVEADQTVSGKIMVVD